MNTNFTWGMLSIHTLHNKQSGCDNPKPNGFNNYYQYKEECTGKYTSWNAFGIHVVLK